MERYSLDSAIRRVRKPMEQIKDVMRCSDVSSVSISKWKGRDADGKMVDKFHTSVNSNLDEEFYCVDEEED